MSSHEFVTLDVFADRPFEGNQLAVFPDATGVPESTLLPITREFCFSETAFVLPGERAGAARVRIFTPGGEAAFAGHPLVGTACVLAERTGLTELELEVPAGAVRVRVEHGDDGLRRATVVTPQPFTVEGTVPVGLVARALGLPETAMRTQTHEPTLCGMGRTYVIAEVDPATLDAAVPDTAAFAEARRAMGIERFAVLAYAHTEGTHVRARMFAPLDGTVEDAATGSANVALVGLLLSLDDGRREDLRLTSRQGEAMGRPSTLTLRAWRQDAAIRASVSGTVVPVTRGQLTLA